MLNFPLTCLKKRNNKRGFSLVELLISVSIFSVISLAVYSTFSSGLTVLRRAKNIDLSFQRSLIKLEKIERELRQTIFSNKMLFSGEAGKINLWGTVDDSPCRITYYFDAATRSITRGTFSLTDAIGEKGDIGSGSVSARPSVFLNNVKGLKFQYYFFDLSSNAYNWIEAWNANSLPIAVRINFFTESREYVTTVFLPQ